MDEADRDFRFEVTGITAIGVEVRFLRATAAFAVEKAQELVSLGSRKVVITDLLNGTQYPPGKFERLVADERRNQPG
jgi:hypothetical protein